MMKSLLLGGALASLLGSFALFSEPSAAGALATVPVPAEEMQAAWGTIKGRVIFNGDKVPVPEELKVDKDQDHCLQKGQLKAEKWKVDPASKGVANVVVFLRPEAGMKLDIHDSLRTPSQKQVVLDQPFCQFQPRILAMREDQTLLAKNPAPVPHNVVVQGFKNSQNVQLSAGSEKALQLFAESNAIGLSCGAHPWMKGYVWVFDHPYFAVTDKDGNFEIKLAPAGNRSVVLWHEEKGWLEGKKGRTVTIPADGIADVGTVATKPD